MSDHPMHVDSNRLTIDEYINKGDHITHVRSEIDAVQFLEKLRIDIKKPGGYVEISHHSCDYPCLCLSYANGIGVLQAFSNPETSLILEGSGLLEPTKSVELPALDELTSFTGNFILDAEAILGAVADYLESFELDSIGEWYML